MKYKRNIKVKNFMEECPGEMSKTQIGSVDGTITTEVDPDKLKSKIGSRETQTKDPPTQASSETETDFQREEKESAESGTQTPIQEITYFLLAKQIGSMSDKEAEEKLKDLFAKMDPEQRRRYLEIHNLESRFRESGLDYNKILKGIDNKDEPDKVPPNANQNE